MSGTRAPFIVAISMLTACALAQGTRKAWKPDRIVVTCWNPPPANDPALAALAAEGYTLTRTPEAGLDVAKRHGLKAMLQDDLLAPASLDKLEQRAKLDALIDRVKVHPALDAYYLGDEPNAAEFPRLGRLVAYLKERDPGHLAYINLYPTYASNQQLGTQGDATTAYREYLHRFVETVKPELISWDHYQLLTSGDSDQYFLNLELIRDEVLRNDLPFLNIVQASTVEKTWRRPNPQELRYLVYTTLAYGGRGISYYIYSGSTLAGGLYQDGKKTPLADSAAVLNHEVGALSPELMQLRTQGVYHTRPLPPGTHPVPGNSPVQLDGGGEFVLGLFGRSDGGTAFMVVNRSHKRAAAAQPRFTRPVRRLEEFDRRTGSWNVFRTRDAGPALSVSLDPGDGRLFRIR